MVLCVTAATLVYVTGIESNGKANSMPEGESNITALEENYIVIFCEWMPENQKQVLSIEGIEYIETTTFGDQGYPAIIIYAMRKIGS